LLHFLKDRLGRVLHRRQPVKKSHAKPN